MTARQVKQPVQGPIDSHNYWEPGRPLDGPEQWYPIKGFEGIYDISTCGRVRRILGGLGTKMKDGRPYEVKTHPNSKGYWIGNLWVNSKRTTFKVHKIIARAFIGEPPVDIAGDAEVHHINTNKNDNWATNVEYLSAYDNMMEMQDRYWRTGKTY